MGCGASVQAATAEQKQLIFEGAVREMMIYCVPKAMDSCDELQVPAPTQVHNLRGTVAKLRAKAKELTGGDAPPPPPAEESKKGGGGMFGGLMDKAQGAIDTAVAGVSGVAGKITSEVVTGLAEQLENILNKVEGQFADTGKMLIEQKKDAMMDVYALIINRIAIDDAVNLVRGKEPWGQQEYDACPPGAISTWLTTTGKNALCAELEPVCQPCIDKFPIVKTWDSTIETYQNVMESMEKYDFLAGLCEKAEVKLDINKWVVEQTVEGLGKLMAKEEEKLRRDPQLRTVAENLRRKPKTFALCFSGAVGYSQITATDFKNRDQ